MSLSLRQKRRYTSKATIYRRDTFGSEAYTKIAEHVPCGIKPTDNYSQLAAAMTLIKQDSVQTSDSIHFEASVDAQDGDIFYIETGSAQQAGEWYQATGAPEIHTFRANFRRLYVNNTDPLGPGQIAA
ncbi:hypothetical protein EON79_20220 [bacterium]|nr:MAG: hypothetical protein EON79_20220 [bacterium]